MIDSSTANGISENTFTKLVSIRDELQKTNPKPSPQALANLRGSFCKAFDRAVTEGRRCKDIIGLDRLAGLSPDSSRTKILANAMVEVDNLNKNKLKKDRLRNIYATARAITNQTAIDTVKA